MKILLSACLAGEQCKYNGDDNYSPRLMELLEGHEIITVCPEVLGGLPIPRIPAEIVRNVDSQGNCVAEVRRVDGISVDEEFRLGAQHALEIAINNEIELAILQSRSPSCGVGVVYDGTFTGNLVEGDGLFVQQLKKYGISAVDVEEFVKKPRMCEM